MKKSELKRIIREEAITMLKESSGDKIYMLDNYLWTSYSPNSGTTAKVVRNSYFTDKKSDDHYDYIAHYILKWATKEKPIAKSKTQKMFKVPVYNPKLSGYDATNYSVWGGHETPYRYMWMIISYGNINVINLFDSKNEASNWLRTSR